MKFVRIPILILGCYFILTGYPKIFMNSKPVIGSVAVIEKGQYRQSDYFKISGAIILGYYVFDQDMTTKNINSFLFPVVSRQFYDSIMDKVRDDKELDSLLLNGTIRPRIYIKSAYKDISESEMDTLMSKTDEKNYEGTVLNSFTDLDFDIKSILGKMKITPQNTLIIDESVTPDDNKKRGWIMLASGTILLLISGVSFYHSFRNKKSLLF